MIQQSSQYDWLSLIEISGPFLAVPVLKEVFPQGLDSLNGIKQKRLRQTYEEWRDAVDEDDFQLDALHSAWIDEVIARTLELDEDGVGDVLKRADWCASHLATTLTEHSVTTSPQFAVVDEQKLDKPLMLVQSYSNDVDLNATSNIDGWVATPADRMATLCRATGCRLGLVTNGERWMLIDAPIGSVVSFASWYARIWSQEPVTLQAFVHFLGIRRFFVDPSERLPALLDQSLKFQDEVTDALGEQVRRAVEVLIQAIDRADQDRNRELLLDINEPELYEAALTVMMRLVFLLCAEEQGLFLMGDERYEAYYAISTLRTQLRVESEEILERRWDAWSRILATFRAVYGGISHENLQLPALGGSLFNPDRFPFLEGRSKDSTWRTDSAKPLPIDNRTVLLLLEAIQEYQGRTLSYRALDVEQIGYVYEGLLERTVARTTDLTLDLGATQKADNPLVTLAELDSAKFEGHDQLILFLEEHSGSSSNRVSNDLAKSIDDSFAQKLLTACLGDTKLYERVRPYGYLLRTDPWGYPLVYPTGAFIVTSGSDRRETGTHYTPKSLTETIVSETLTPVAYIGPSEGKIREQWQLKQPVDLLDLKICDPAMGSGAFLVQACRWLADRLVESWALAEEDGFDISIEGNVLFRPSESELLPLSAETRALIARRLIAERCIYGVDMNPVAVELAKLSIWLVTLAKGRPFGFLDHNLRCGDSLLGIHDLNQLTELAMAPESESQQRLFGQSIREAVHEAIKLRIHLRETPIRDIYDVEVMAQLDAEARQKLRIAELIADAMVGQALVSEGDAHGLQSALSSLALQGEQAIAGDNGAIEALAAYGTAVLASNLPPTKAVRRPFHWPLEFPEVFLGERAGFDAFIGNPPFLGNRLWKSTMGDKLQWQCQMILGTTPGKVDLCVIFHRRVVDLLRSNGCYGLLALSNIAEGSSIAVGLGVIVQNGNIFFSKKGMPWPGKASVVVAIISFIKGKWSGNCDCDGAICMRIGERLEPEVVDLWKPKILPTPIFSFEGVNNSKGLAFVLTKRNDWFDRLANEPNSLLRPYITGDDITSHALRENERWALDILDRNLEQIKYQWPEAYQFLVEKVQLTRTPAALNSYKGLYERWWQFWNHRAEPMRRLRAQKYFVAFAKATKYPFCMMAPTDWIYTNKVLLIGVERQDMFAICLSSFFRNWLHAFSLHNLGADTNTLGLSIRESVSTFPVPSSEISIKACAAATQFQESVVAWSTNNGCGLTSALNQLNTPTCADPLISEMRQLMVDIDIGVASAYGWDDLEIGYDFREFSGGSANDRWRWALSAEGTADLMQRLRRLNQERYERHPITALDLMPSVPPKRGRSRKGIQTLDSPQLFDDVDV